MKSLEEEELKLAASRKRFNYLILGFKLFFISITLITLALITYLVQSQSLDDSIHHNHPSLQFNSPIISTESQQFNLSLQTAVQELEHATSLILSASNENPKTELAFDSCRRWLRIGSGQIEEVIGANPFPSDQERVEMYNRIFAAEGYINSCLDDLATTAESSAAVDQVWAAVVEAASHLRERGDNVMGYDKMLRKLGEIVAENLIIICLLGFQMFYLFFFFWIVITQSR